MRFQKHLQGFVVFVTILTCVIAVYEYINWPFGKVPRAEAPASVLEPLNDELPPLAYDVRLVSLDFINGKSYTTLVIKLQPGQPAPERLLVKTRFYVPGGEENQGWMSEVGITRPSAVGGRVEVTATSACDWCARPDTPRSGYFADVYVSAQYEGKTYPPSSFVTPVEAAVPVVVQAERKPKS